MTTDPPPGPLLLTAADVAQLTGFSASHARKLINRGEIPSVKIGGSRRVPRTDLEDWIARLPRDQRPAGAQPLTGRYAGRLAR